MGNAAKIRNRKYATRKLFGQNAVLIQGQRVELTPDGRVPSDASRIPQRETYQSFCHDLEVTERAKKDAAASERALQMKRDILYKRPSPELQKRCPKIPPDLCCSVDEARKMIREAIASMKETLLRESGIELAERGLQKLWAVVNVNKELWWADPACWLALYDYVDELQVFEEGDRIVGEPTTPEPEPQSERMTQDQLQTVLDKTLREESTQTRDGERRIKAAVQDAFMGGGQHQLWDGWLAQLLRDYGISLSKEDQRACFEWSKQMNLSIHQPSTYDAMRRFLVDVGRLDGDIALTCREVLENQYRNNQITDREYLRLLQFHADKLDRPRKEAGI